MIYEISVPERKFNAAATQERERGLRRMSVINYLANPPSPQLQRCISLPLTAQCNHKQPRREEKKKERHKQKGGEGKEKKKKKETYKD